MNKSDLSDSDAPEGFLSVSVKQGAGLDKLHSRLAELLGSMDVEEESVMVTHARHRKALVDALDYVERGLSLLGPEEQLDLVALEWRRAWSSLGEILGIGDVEFILDRVFSEFCVGK